MQANPIQEASKYFVYDFQRRKSIFAAYFDDE